MEIFNNLPVELKREVMSYTSDLCDATPRQLRFFMLLKPYLQEQVLSGKYWRILRDHAFKKRCNFLGRNCTLRFSFYGYFTRPGSIEESEHYDEHGMCSKCKQEEVRQAARRQERLDGLARFQQAFLADDEIGMLENERWCDVDSLYDRCESWEDYMERRYPDFDSDY